MASRTIASLVLTFNLILVCVGCGGGGSAPISSVQTASATAPLTITAAQVMPKVGDLWTLQNGYGDITTISIEPLLMSDPAAASCTVWHYQKSNPRAYWDPGISADLWFIVCPQTGTGNWYTAGSIVHNDLLPASPPDWSTIKPDLPSTNLISGWLISAAATTGERSSLVMHFKDLTSWATNTTTDARGNVLSEWTSTPIPTPVNLQIPWRMDSYIETVTTPAYSGPTLVTEQWEDDCAHNAPLCVHEKWNLAPGNLGIVKITQFQVGANTEDPLLAAVRVH